MRLVCVMLLLLLLLHCVCSCAAHVEHRCTFDKKFKNNGPLPVVRHVPRKGDAGYYAYTADVEVWEPIRFKVFTEDLKNPSRYCTAKGEFRPDFQGGMVVCRAVDVLTEEKKALLVDYLIPESMKLHSDRLLVRPMEPFILHPFILGTCALFTVPPEHYTIAIDNADFIFFVAAGPTENNDIAWGVPCAVAEDGRPSVGALNFGAQHVSARRGLARTVAHEIAHALGFSAHLFEERRMMSVVPSVRGKRNVFMVSSKKTLEVTRSYFDCDSALGMELEDEGGQGTASSHWERRNLKDELMAGVAGIGYYSAFTMAAFEDLGYFRANWGMEEVMSWGADRGCDFLNNKCIQNGTTKYPDMFCTKTSKRHHCTSDHLTLGVCLLVKYSGNLSPEFQYFHDGSLGAPPHELTDYCPVVLPVEAGECTSTSSNIIGSRIGPNSRCLHGRSLRLGSISIGDVCVEVLCKNNTQTLEIRYTGDDAWYPCPYGSTVEPGPPFSSGYIICPKYTDVCLTLAGNQSIFLQPNRSKRRAHLTKSVTQGQSLPEGTGMQRDKTVRVSEIREGSVICIPAWCLTLSLLLFLPLL